MDNFFVTLCGALIIPGRTDGPTEGRDAGCSGKSAPKLADATGHESRLVYQAPCYLFELKPPQTHGCGLLLQSATTET